MNEVTFTTYSAKKSGLDPSAYNFLFHVENLPRPLAQKWKPTYCYRGRNRDIWSIYPNAPFDAILNGDRKKWLLSFLTQYCNMYIVGPLDYCGIAKLVHGRADDMYVSLKPFLSLFVVDFARLVICDHDPRIPEFYIKRCMLEKEAMKLKAKGAEHSGIEPAVKRKLLKTISTLRDCTPSSSSRPSSPSPFSFDSSPCNITDSQTEETHT